MTTAGYLPPTLPKRQLRQQLGAMFMSGKIEEHVHLLLTDDDYQVLKSIPVTHTPDMLDQLLEEYAKWWRMMLLYPKQRVVAPPPVFIVTYAHFSLGMDEYFNNLREYLGVGGLHHRRWRGPKDIDGLLDTTFIYRQTYGEPTNPWLDMFRIVDRIVKSDKVIVLRP
jgi:hypothetical protein